MAQGIKSTTAQEQDVFTAVTMPTQSIIAHRYRCVIYKRKSGLTRRRSAFTKFNVADGVIKN
jgi:hypothetical protein